MSDPKGNLPPVDIQAEPSERARAEANRDAERANLEAAILRFNTNYNPVGGPPQGRDLPRLVSPINREETLLFCPLGLIEGVQPRDKLKEEARLISLDCPNSYLDQEKMLGI